MNLECGRVSNVNFGNSIPTTVYDPNALTTRGYNWELQTGLQQELRPQVSFSATYVRRWFGNLRGTTNTAVTSSNYSSYCIPAPLDPNLPGGGGYQQCGLNDITRAVRPRQQRHCGPAAAPAGVRRRRSVRQRAAAATADDAGRRQLRPDADQQLRLCGHFEFRVCLGNRQYHDCRAAHAGVLRRPSAVPAQLEGAGRLSAAWYGIQTAATLQSLPGPQIAATYSVTSALAAPSLGRNLSAGNATVDLIAPGTMYGDRLNQMDFRASKIFKFATRSRLQANVDLYNLFNANPVLALNNTYGVAWQRPLQILQGRLLKFSVQLDF